MTWLWVAAIAVIAIAIFRHLERSRRQREEARAWLRGVRSVLSDDSDAAIAALSDAARLGKAEAFDTYLALGALFRRTGDLARAVRLHRNMLVYPGLEPARRVEVERELAEDYRRSGMLAEAEELLAPLAPTDRAAGELLREVLADQGRWSAAAEVQRRIAAEGPDAVRAHLLAAAAREAISAAPDQAAGLAREAIAADGTSADAMLAKAEVDGAEGRTLEALAAFRSALSADPRVGVLAWPALGRVGDHDAALQILEELVAATPADAALRMLQGRVLHAAGRNAAALEAFRSALQLDELGEVTVSMRDLLRSADAPGPDDLAARHDLLVAALVRKARAPRCARCGAEASRRQWRCRRCGCFDPHR